MTQRRIDVDTINRLLPKASNSANSRLVHRERVYYRDAIFYEGIIPNEVNTWAEHRLYGRVNTYGNTVYPLQTSMKALRFSNGSTSYYALGFVADAWRDFSEKMRELSNNNVVHRDSPWASPSIYKAYESSQLKYHDYLLENVYPNFVDNFLDDSLTSSRVRGLDSFMVEFNAYMHSVLLRNGPLTFSSFLEGSYTSPLVSGLVLEMGNDSYDDDATKALKYRDLNFEVAASVASQYGFCIDRNIPWRLVADLTNPAMLEYMVGVPISGPTLELRNSVDACDEVIPSDPENIPDYYGFSQIPGFERVKRHINVYRAEDGFTFRPGYLNYQSLSNQPSPDKIFETLFNTSYSETWTRDMEVLAVYMLSFYNTYADNYPVLNKLSADRDNLPRCENAQRVLARREQAPDNVFSLVGGKYRTKWALESFYNIRMSERQQKRDPHVAKKEIRRIMSVYDASSGTEIDKYNQALRYAQQNFIGGVPGQAFTLETVRDILDQQSQ